MRQSHLFSVTDKKDPIGAEVNSHKLLVRAGFIDQLASGIWTLLPLGFRVFSKVQNIIREEMDAIGSQEILMPSMQPKQLWTETERWESFEPPLFTFHDRHNKEFCIAPTHEEVVTDLARRFIHSYKQLPVAVYQIQTKFRNEMRSSGGLLRVREFSMKDLYSFHANIDDLKMFYQKVIHAYFRIYERCGLSTVMVEASSGSIGGSESNEFMAISSVGEDSVFVCQTCQSSYNQEVLHGQSSVCPKCHGDMKKKQGIEVGHIFQLLSIYSKKMRAQFTDKDGNSKPFVMGCYGIGVGRLLATILEIHHDEMGMIWPKEVSPFQAHLIALGRAQEKANVLYQQCLKQNIDILFDDRDEPASTKFKDSDLLGIGIRLIMSDKTGNNVEYKERTQKKEEIITPDEVVAKIHKFYQ